MDILIFAVVAGVIFFKLFSVLGRKTGHEQPPPMPMADAAGLADDHDNIVPLHRDEAGEDDYLAGLDDSLMAGFTQIREADGNFDPEQFLAGARAAFEMILDAFHKAELEKVRPFLDSAVYRSFATALEERDVGDTRRLIELVAINRCEPIEAEMKGREAHITIRFESDQTDVVKDSEDRIVAGDPSSAVEVTDIWTFARDTRARDPNWQLVATRSPN
ncbi:MAG: Tim44/TimA family putative adaptor protein [Alphaproteobacteria bacterium]|nr:Tim44 domain-containing protein [Rhodospirillaceae bacterium]MBT7646978.1 Tim44 domain-containing protein [Rhodospirillaceae bacterium]MDG2480383.1 Tim44/TimA family putative adaptor protein [Alphaproteobacteria bacterium]